MKLNLSPLLFILAILVLGGLSSGLIAATEKKRVLVLHSYHQGFHWTDRITQGINSVFEQRDDIELFVNYMDTKRMSSKAYYEQLKVLYQTKYQFTTFDAIISSDDNALDFLLDSQDQLFPNTPVIFSGLNNFSDDRLRGLSNFTGVYESYDVAGTIELMLKLHPETKTIAAITDDTRSGHIFKELIESADKLNQSVDIKYLHDFSKSELQQALNSLPENSLALWAIYLRMPNGSTLSSEESVGFVSEVSPVPTYCVWDVVGQGVVGGKITSPNFQGKSAAEIALRILQGEDPSSIPVKGSSLENIFDYNTMQRFGIDLESLPSNSIVLNKPVNFYTRYKQYVWIFSSIILVLLIAVISLVTIIILRKKSEQYEGLAMRDELTGVYNRRYLEETGGHKLAEAHRHHEKTCLLMLDLDHFKAVNDTHGHPFGDKVLQAFSKLMQKHCRSEDIIARIGGEEFIILMSHCDIQKAKQKAEAIRTSVETLKPDGVMITTSIGIAELFQPSETLVSLIARADKAIYKAKNAGRNQVVAI